MSYDLTVQPKDSQSIVPRQQAEAFLASLPGVQPEKQAEKTTLTTR